MALQFTPDFPYYLQSLAGYYGARMVPVDTDAHLVFLMSPDGTAEECVFRLALGDHVIDVHVDLAAVTFANREKIFADAIRDAAQKLMVMDNGRHRDIEELERIANL